MDELQQVKAELAVLRGAFVEVLLALMAARRDVLSQQQAAGAVSRVGATIEEIAETMGDRVDQAAFQHMLHIVHQLRAELAPDEQAPANLHS